MRGNSKPFGKQLSPHAEISNHSGNNFRHTQKCQTFCGMICGRPAKYINKKALWRNESSKCFVKGGGYPLSRIALFDMVYHRVNWGVEDKQKKHPFDCSNERSDKKEAATYSPALHCSTIGASGLNFSVRNGKRWDPTAITTWCIFFSWQVLSWQVDKLFVFLSFLLFVLLSLLFYQATRLLVYSFTINY